MTGAKPNLLLINIRIGALIPGPRYREGDGDVLVTAVTFEEETHWGHIRLVFSIILNKSNCKSIDY